jgi:hypothetical protein
MLLEPGQIASVKGPRLTIPVDVIRGAGWPTTERIVVVFELLRSGYARLFRDSDVRAALDLMRAEAAVAASHSQSEPLAIVADRYRMATLYAEHRVFLSKEIAAVLLGASREPLFAQPRDGWLELMSMPERHRRLGDLDAVPALDIEAIFRRTPMAS